MDIWTAQLPQTSSVRGPAGPALAEAFPRHLNAACGDLSGESNKSVERLSTWLGRPSLIGQIAASEEPTKIAGVQTGECDARNSLRHSEPR